MLKFHQNMAKIVTENDPYLFVWEISLFISQNQIKHKISKNTIVIRGID